MAARLHSRTSAMSSLGSKTVFSFAKRHVRSALISRHRFKSPEGPFGAKTGLVQCNTFGQTLRPRDPRDVNFRSRWAWSKSVSVSLKRVGLDYRNAEGSWSYDSEFRRDGCAFGSGNKDLPHFVPSGKWELIWRSCCDFSCRGVGS